MIITPPSTNTAEFGLQNKNSAAERISASRSTTNRVTQNNISERNINNDGQADLGLQDRGTGAERVNASQSLKGRVIENHGFEAKKATRDALANNTQIINIPVQRRGSLLDISA